MSPAFSPTRYVISTRRKVKRELLLLPAMNETIGQLDQPECCPTFQRENCIDISEFESHMASHAVGLCEQCLGCGIMRFRGWRCVT